MSLLRLAYYGVPVDDVTPGYERYGEQGLRLVDPVDCPGGHRREFGLRTFRPCAEHNGHPGWLCTCGVEQWLHVVDGHATYVTELPCAKFTRAG